MQLLKEKNHISWYDENHGGIIKQNEKFQICLNL